MTEQPVLKALVVVDEILAQEEMILLLDEYSNIAVAWRAETVEQARGILKAHRPDIVFLDIQLRGGDGFELIPYLRETTEVIFITAYDKYAVRSFDNYAEPLPSGG